MLNHVIQRLVMIVPILFGVTFLVFAAMYLIPGDPARLIAGDEATEEAIAEIRRSHGLDKPWYEQYGRYVANVARGDLGRSVSTGESVSSLIGQRIPATLQLAVAAIAIATAIGITAGVVAGTRQYSWFDNLSMLVALLGVSMPSFWLGLMLMMLFSVQLGWLPTVGRETPLHVVLPAVTLGASSAGIIARITRSSMLEVLGQDYVRTATAKGLSFRLVIWRHALRNALIPTVTIIGLEFGQLLSGAIITETIFAWPGIGLLLIQALRTRDIALAQGVILVIALSFILVNLIVDLVYTSLDPRIRSV